MTPQELKNSILQMAIQGKLVEQDISESVVGIQSSLVANDSELYDIPENWKWCAIRDVATINTGLSFKKQDQKNEYTGDLRVLRGGNIGDDYKYHLFDNDVYVDFKQFEDKCIQLLEGDVIIPSVTSIEKICKTGYIDADLNKITAGGFVFIIRSKDKNLLNAKFMQYFIASSFNREQCKPNIRKSGQAFYNLKKSGFIEQPICIPPIDEQKRIVAKVEEILTYIDKYEEAWTKLEAFNKKFPDDIQKSILQMAIQGKLVEQREEEGTAEELYKQIQEEKNDLLQKKEIKKDKRLFNIQLTENGYMFDIPLKWKWVNLGSILKKLTDGTHRTPKYASSGVKFVSVKDMSSGTLYLDSTKFITEEEHEELFKRCNPEKGDILLSKVGTTGVPAIIETDEPFSLFVSVALLKFNRELIYDKYLYYSILSPLVQLQARENTRGVGNKNWVLDAIAKTVLPLPPFEEQKRIVAKIEELLSMCNRLK